MLETKELSKIYKPKKGVPVTALNKISLKFPDKGMIFLLGKSGSGKSTLLNVLGGLDKYDGGEIIIKGVSSKDFKQQHFDSYRNTYVGFIFQEYNILEEFTVGANIALAIELQGKKATDEEIGKILKEVDLEGYGSRKPNELSGGQKQRVAIARALVKSPEIIMADEPTGALDSNTGRQVLETLKKLSSNKLVIVVSHDREFAEQYADRIIELSDGDVISDLEIEENFIAGEDPESKLSYNDDVIEVPSGYHLTEDDRNAINDYIVSISAGDLKLKLTKGNTAGKKFSKTDESKIKAHSSSEFKLIKSKLPMRNAIKIGASGLKHKKIRLAVTIILSCISFGLFGLSDTFGSYNHIKTCTNSIVDSDINYASVNKSKLVGKGVNRYWRDYGYRISKQELNEIYKQTGTKMTGVYQPMNSDLSFTSHFDDKVKLSETDISIYSSNFAGFSEVNEDLLKGMKYKLLYGKLPDGTKNEILISKHISETFVKAKYSDLTFTTNAKGEQQKNYSVINSASEMIGKVININGTDYTVTGVVDTKFDLSRYQDLIVEKKNMSSADKLIQYALTQEFYYASQNNMSLSIMVGEGFIDKMIASTLNIPQINNGYLYLYNKEMSIDPTYMGKLSDIKNQKIVWLDGEKTSLGEKELIVTSNMISLHSENGKGSTSVSGENSPGIDYKDIISKDNSFSSHAYKHDTDEDLQDSGYKIVGIIEMDEKNSYLSSSIFANDSFTDKFVDNTDGIYNYAIGGMPADEKVEDFVSFCYKEDSDVRYPLQSSVTYQLDMVNDILNELSTIFLYIGLGFAAFAALMLANFIGTSISYKKQEIGILRAIGSRSNDVFRIFFSESFIIAITNFVLSALGVFAATFFINYYVRKNLGILITILNFGPRQVLLLLAASIFVAAIASFLPVKKIASKRPIDAIRNR